MPNLRFPCPTRAFSSNSESVGGCRVKQRANLTPSWSAPLSPNRIHAAGLAVTRVDGFNIRRLQEPIGYIPPAEAEDRFYAKLAEPEMAA
ncbi:hypothetical protein HDIA_3732 [Hartmannibacter diazotrophicus]|uniref:Uncharacterized protein n=1 Tax=Hartmannibacter diazotrophicus TaxID=1482074 RepID=A0A2C9DAL1_9HYPH|nr:hypothetical protein HDIA_3732 [Hartmannibacter diazotrophicus]